MNPFQAKRLEPKQDPHPDELTDDERVYIEERIRAGAAPAHWLIRKLVRIIDKQRGKLAKLEARGSYAEFPDHSEAKR